MKIVIVSCSRQPDDTRTINLKSGFSSSPSDQILVIKNSRKSMLRYFELIRLLIKTRSKFKPDIYLITPKSYGVLAVALMIVGKRQIVFDESVNPIEWLAYEQHSLKPYGLIGRSYTNFYRSLVSRCTYILADTKAHAEFSARLNRLSLEKYFVIPSGTDERAFYPKKYLRSPNLPKGNLRVFYCAQSPIALHGLTYVLEAAVKLKIVPGIEFVVMGDEAVKSKTTKALKLGAKVKYLKLAGLNKLANEARKSDLCLGGPFGASVQSQFVITSETYQFIACGKPVMIGRSKINKFFADEKNCLIAKQGSSQMIAKKILWAYQNKKYLNRIGQNGLKTYKTFFSKEQIDSTCQTVLAFLRPKIS